ncbi:CU044_5270 family protein [Streptomyces lasiicapitis]|uniref:CU044_5270 family protein n=1 Tax=Streptomyces lasiicapitis TaxID=1923961 RepID=UPI003333F072
MKSQADPDFPTSPSPSERDLPPGRHLLLREHLMTEIRQSESKTRAEAPEPAAPRRRKPWLRPVLVAGAVAASVAAGLLVASPFGGDSAEAAPSKEAVAMLKEIAAAAKRSPAPKDVRDDQFTYIKSKVAYGSEEGLDPLHQREIWLSVDGRHTGLLHEPVNDHKNVRMKPELPLADYDSNYRNLEKLPTDPVNMFDWLNKVADRDSNGKPFVVVGDITREALMPPEQAAALYLAAAKIPGVELDDDAVDAAGRHGVAITWENDGERSELIFDKKTKAYLGERSVLTEDKPFGKKGEVLANTAVLERKVVDKAGERP